MADDGPPILSREERGGALDLKRQRGPRPRGPVWLDATTAALLDDRFDDPVCGAGCDCKLVGALGVEVVQTP